MTICELNVSKRSSFGKWLQGYNEAGGWMGRQTVSDTWENHKARKPNGCSWKAFGIICAALINPHYSSISELQEENYYLKSVLKENNVRYIGDGKE